MIDFRIETFLTVCKYMNFTKASQELNITQPAVSQHIRYLEEYYNTKLFSYNNKKISLTTTGTMLRNAAITMKHDEQYLKKTLLEKNKHQNKLNIGVTLTVGEYMIASRVASYSRQNPQTPISIVVDNTKELLEALNEGTIDCAIVEGNFPKHEYDFEVMRKENLIAVCSAGHQFKKFPTSLEDLLDETIITRERGSGGREILVQNLKGKNLMIQDFQNIIEVNNIGTIKLLAMEDCGIAFLYETAVAKELDQGQLKEINLQDFHIRHDITFLWRKNSIFSDYYRTLSKEFL